MRPGLHGMALGILAVAAIGACGGSSGILDGGSSGAAAIEAGPEASSESSDGGSPGAADVEAVPEASSGGFGDGSSIGADAGRGPGSGTDAGRAPVNHRPSDAQCSTPAAPGDCAGPGPSPGGCTSDSNCTAGTNGRCLHPGGGPAADCSCTYDACVVDTDCPSGKTCACHGSPYTDSAGNACVTGNCRVDADCGAGGYCSPSSLNEICGDSLAGYYCHTAADLCIDDSDCSPNVPASPDGPACAYGATDARWECVARPICE